MIEKRLFSYDPETGTTKWFYFDDVTDEVTLETSRDVEDLIEQNKISMNAHDERAPWADETHNRVASIPDFMYYEMKAAGKIDDQAFMTRWLHDKDNACFRTRPGRI